MGFYDNNNSEIKDGKFNQAFFYMERLHELISRIDRLYINPLFFNPNYDSYNYEIIARDCQSAFLNIFAKLTNQEKADLKKIRDELFAILRKRSPFETINGINGAETKFIPHVWQGINDKIFEFRTKLEEAIENHDLGNPGRKKSDNPLID